MLKSILIFILVMFIISIAVTVTVLILNNKSPKFNCSATISDEYQPECSKIVRITDLETPLRKFLTTDKVSPISASLPTSAQPNKLIYYYGHPTAIMVGELLYSFPFILRTSATSPVITLSPYTFSDQITDTTLTPFKQLAFGVSSSGPQLTFNNLVAPFTKANISAFPTPHPSSPYLTTKVQSGNFGVFLAEGLPYITISTAIATAYDISIPTPIAPDSGISVISPGLTYNYYIVWNEVDKRTCGVLIFDSVATDTSSFASGVFTFRLASISTTMFYTLMKDGEVESIDTVLRTFTRFLTSPLVEITDIITTENTVVIEYTSYIITYSYAFMWIIPYNTHNVIGLTEFPHDPSSFNFPNGRGLYITTPLADITTFEQRFYTVWDKLQVPDDFSYVLPYTQLINNGPAVVDTSNDLYELSMSIRIMLDSSMLLPEDYLNTCVSAWKTQLNELKYDSSNQSIFFNSLGTDLGLISKLSYLLLTYINLYNVAISGFMSTASTAYEFIMNHDTRDQIGTILNTALATTYTNVIVLQYMEFYNCTIPDINVRGSTVEPMTQYYGRMGEVLSFVWACSYIARRVFANGLMSEMANALYSIVAGANMDLVRGQCAWKEVSKYLPWNGMYTQNNIGYKLDPNGLAELGTSPDAVFIQGCMPFTPATHSVMRPITSNLFEVLKKILRCRQPIDSDGGKIYVFDNFMDSLWVYYTLYLFDNVDESNLLLTGVIPEDLKFFVNGVTQAYKLPGLFMNLKKLKTT